MRGAIAALLTMVTVLAVPPGAVSAHAALESSTPAANSVLEEGPGEIVLDFDEAVEADLASIDLFAGDGRSVALGTPAAGADGSVVQSDVPTLDDGIYAVIWRVTSIDGHVINGAFSFQVGAAAAGSGQALIEQVSSGIRADTAVRWAYGIARYLSLAGAITLIGGVWWLLQFPAGVAGRRSPRRLVTGAWAALAVGSVAAFGLFGAEAVAGSLGDAFDPSVWGDVATTHTGRMLLLRAALAGVVGALLALRRSRTQGWWRGAGFAASVLLLYTFPASGHPKALDPSAVWIAVDLAHLAGITVWIGGLTALVALGSATLAEPEGARVAKRFSLAATICVPVIVVSGVGQALKLAGGFEDITATDWGRLLLTKVTVVVALLAVAGVSRWLLRHDGAASMRRTVIAEALLGLVVVGIAAGMVTLPPEPAAASQPFAVDLSVGGLIAIISLSPGSVGNNEVHITMTPPGGSITPVVSATARVSLPADGIPTSPVTLVQEGNNHYSGSVTFPRSGEWTFEVIVQVTEADSVLLTTTVPIP